MKKWFWLLLIMALLNSNRMQANNVKIQNVSIINNGPGNIRVQFDLSWENSWRVNTGQNNYDGYGYFLNTGPWVLLVNGRI